MKKFHFAALFTGSLLFFTLSQCKPKAEGMEGELFYELRIYHLAGIAQEKAMDAYLEHAFLPALKRNHIRDIGVFKYISEIQDSIPTIFVLYPFEGLNRAAELYKALPADTFLLQKGENFLNAPHDSPPYERLEVIIMKPFKEMPYLRPSSVTGERDKRVYELRSYESPTEALFQNKVEMFNEGGEVKLFEDVGFNAVFYGEVIAGSRMPNLMYMTTFKDMASRDSLWKVFFDTSKWNELWNDPYYANNVNKADILLLYPTSYSDY